MQKLALWSNRLSQEAIRNLCLLLPNLLELNLSWNNLTELPSEIQQLSHLQRLILWNNHISEETRRAIAQWLPNTKIEF